MNIKGFTLVELSIVLVIIGLLIGGILVGNSLIQSARINAQVSQIQQYDIAYQTFKKKFKQIPGDSKYFSPIGNNDGRLLNNMAYMVKSDGERDDFFSHLRQAGILNGDYGLNYNRYTSPGSPYPKAKISTNSMHGIGVTDNMIGTVFYFLGVSITDTTNTDPNWNIISPTGIMSPQSAFAIDNKMDDGNPNLGTIISSFSWCTNSHPQNYMWGTGHCNAEQGIPYPANSGRQSGNCGTNQVDWHDDKYNVALNSDNECRLLIKASIN